MYARRDPGQRIPDLVGNRGGESSENGEPVEMPYLLLEAFQLAYIHELDDRAPYSTLPSERRYVHPYRYMDTVRAPEEGFLVSDGSSVLEDPQNRVVPGRALLRFDDDLGDRNPPYLILVESAHITRAPVSQGDPPREVQREDTIDHPLDDILPEQLLLPQLLVERPVLYVRADERSDRLQGDLIDIRQGRGPVPVCDYQGSQYRNMVAGQAFGAR